MRAAIEFNFRNVRSGKSCFPGNYVELLLTFTGSARKKFCFTMKKLRTTILKAEVKHSYTDRSTFSFNYNLFCLQCNV